jgi:transcriptional regulator with XRE-family HTH domain
MTRPPKRNSGNRSVKDYLFQVSSQFVTQLLEIMESEGIGRAKLAKRLGVSKGRVSQILNHPGNLSLENIVRFTHRLDRKVAIVVYDDGDRRYKKVPILPQIFLESWKRNGRPRDYFALNSTRAIVVLTHPDTDHSRVLNPSAPTKTGANVVTFLKPVDWSTDTLNVGVTTVQRTGTHG